MRSYEEEAKIASAAHLDIEGKTEEAIATLETINNMSSMWHLAQVSQTLTPNIIIKLNLTFVANYIFVLNQ